MGTENLRKFGEGFPAGGLAECVFPVRDDQPENIVEEGVQALIDHAQGRGITYFDTAYSYHGDGQRRRSYQGALRKYPRNSYYLADKLPIWLIKEAADTDKYFYGTAGTLSDRVF